MNTSTLWPHRRGTRAAFVVLAVLSAACSAVSDPHDTSCIAAAEAIPAARDTLAALQWNVLARDFVTKYRTDPSARPYTLLSAAQYAATMSVRQAETGACASVRAAIRAASADILSYLYPAESLAIRARASSQRTADSTHGLTAESRVAGELLGKTAAAPVLARARVDGVDAVWSGTIQTTPGSWRSSGAPATPMLGQMLPWVLASGREFRPAAPPSFASAAFNEALAEVKSMSLSRTEAQTALAVKWALCGGTFRTQGYWNMVAADLAASAGQSARRRAHARVAQRRDERRIHQLL